MILTTDAEYGSGTFTAFQCLLENDGHLHQRFMHLNCLFQQAVAEESECCQYVCPGLQHFVLGDYQVGKTSLVRSLTGERFDTEQNTTQGIEERFVDNEWNTLEFTNGHASGKFISCFKETLVRSMLFGRDRKEPLSDSTRLDCMAVLMVIFLYAGRIEELLSVIVYCTIHFMLVLVSLSHILLCTASAFVSQLLRSVAYIFVLFHCVSLIRCTLKGVPLFGVIGEFVAVMTTYYSTGIFESQQFGIIITFSILVTDAMLFGVVQLPLLFLEFTVKWFQNHFQGTSAHPGQDKFEFGKIRRALEMLSFLVIGFNGFSTTMSFLLHATMTSDLVLAHASHHILVGRAHCLPILVSAQSAFVLVKLLKVHWSWKALIVFITIIFPIGLILLPITRDCAAIFASFSCSILLLACLLVYFYKITPVAADIKCNVVQLMDAFCDAYCPLVLGIIKT